MEFLKNEIDKTAQCAMIFSHTKWIISFDDIQCDTPTSSDDIQYFDDIKDPISDIKDPISDIKINKIEKKDIGPLEFFKQSLDLYEDDDTIKNKLFTFISTQKISNKYTKKEISMIMDGITQNKWNIYICKLFSFLLDISFEYRKQNICYTNNSRFIIKK